MRFARWHDSGVWERVADKGYDADHFVAKIETTVPKL